MPSGYLDISLVAQSNTDEYASPGELYSSGSLYSNPGFYTVHGAFPGGVVLEGGGSDGMHPGNDSCTEPGPVYSLPFRRRDSAGSREFSSLGNTGTNDGA